VTGAAPHPFLGPPVGASPARHAGGSPVEPCAYRRGRGFPASRARSRRVPRRRPPCRRARGTRTCGGCTGAVRAALALDVVRCCRLARRALCLDDVPARRTEYPLVFVCAVGVDATDLGLVLIHRELSAILVMRHALATLRRCAPVRSSQVDRASRHRARRREGLAVKRATWSRCPSPIVRRSPVPRREDPRGALA
jgi:hypothetical protein